ncbi:AAA family ATPase [Candidatus Parcubacteria bacterium]|nr:AAA family ATPase [Candidatus Parcubacteria bacterium]
MSKIRIKSISIKNYRSFKGTQSFIFPNEDYKKPVAIVGYNNSGKTNLMNCILYGIGERFVSENTFEKSDLHRLNYKNLINICTVLDSSEYEIWSDYHGRLVEKSIKGEHSISSKFEDGEIKSKVDPSFFGANKHYNIFFINFHKIKEEISTQKTSWGNLKSFLAKHIKKIVDSDEAMKGKKEDFEKEISESTDGVLKGSSLNKFIELIKKNYTTNLRNNDCSVEFGLPGYEDIFLQMMFKIGLNGDKENLVPIDHFGDGYISMFVMAVIQAIAESNTEDQCLFLFEEPESFLHENHQEYFYKTVLCGLSEKGHQVIYTTHSAKMVDIFDTKGLIRLEVDENNETIKKYNNIAEFSTQRAEGEIVTLEKYNDFIRNIEPNLNKILFSKKVILVEGPNDLMVYNFVIKKKVLEKIVNMVSIGNKEKYAETYLNFHNISIIPHHGKSTALYLIEVCKHFGLDYFVINDWDFENDDLSFDTISEFDSLENLQTDKVYTLRSGIEKGKITNNWNLINKAGKDRIHFNTPKIEKIIDYDSDDKNSLKIWEKLNDIGFSFNENLFPENLEKFLELYLLEFDNFNNPEKHIISGQDDIRIEDIPF